MGSYCEDEGLLMAVIFHYGNDPGKYGFISGALH
jgi:hypothetical protein